MPPSCSLNSADGHGPIPPGPSPGSPSCMRPQSSDAGPHAGPLHQSLFFHSWVSPIDPSSLGMAPGLPQCSAASYKHQKQHCISPVGIWLVPAPRQKLLKGTKPSGSGVLLLPPQISPGHRDQSAFRRKARSRVQRAQLPAAASFIATRISWSWEGDGAKGHSVINAMFPVQDTEPKVWLAMLCLPLPCPAPQSGHSPGLRQKAGGKGSPSWQSLHPREVREGGAVGGVQLAQDSQGPLD